MKFARVSGLSPVKYKAIPGKEPTFHYPPPVRYGIYAFIWPYMEPFLWAWSAKNKADFAVKGYRVFNYTGPIWTHMDCTSNSAVVRNWFLTDTKYLDELLKEEKKEDRRYLSKDTDVFWSIKDPYKRGKGGCCSRDHLEVFIDGRYCGNVK